jgi:hypothetical protein
MAKARKTPKPKQPTVERIDPKQDPEGVYPRMTELIDRRRSQLREARISIEWKYGWKRNKDGQLILGSFRKVGESDKQHHGFDFVMSLNREAWNAFGKDEVHRALGIDGETMKQALIFHELLHGDVSLDQNGNPKKDARGRQCFRKRKHDIEEHTEVIEVFGCYKADLVNFVTIAMKSPKPPPPSLLDGLESDEPAGGGGADDGKNEAAVAEPEGEPKEGAHAAQVASERKKRPSPMKARAGREKTKER